jgi:hypothetical protein
MAKAAMLPVAMMRFSRAKALPRQEIPDEVYR